MRWLSLTIVVKYDLFPTEFKDVPTSQNHRQTGGLKDREPLNAVS